MILHRIVTYPSLNRINFNIFYLTRTLHVCLKCNMFLFLGFLILSPKRIILIENCLLIKNIKPKYLSHLIIYEKLKLKISLR